MKDHAFLAAASGALGQCAGDCEKAYIPVIAPDKFLLLILSQGQPPQLSVPGCAVSRSSESG